MSKKIFKAIYLVLVMLLSQTGLACDLAPETSSTEFCSAFKAIAQCHCTKSGLTKSMCSDMDILYRRMVALFSTLERACEYQHQTSTQHCIDSWNCYRQGGVTSSGMLCNGTGQACA